MKVYKQTGNFVLRDILDSNMLIPVGKQILTENVLIELNETAAFIYKALKNEMTDDGLVAALEEEYEAEKELLRSDIAAALEKFVNLNAVSEKEV